MMKVSEKRVHAHAPAGQQRFASGVYRVDITPMLELHHRNDA
jgi:hypothetical protein